MITRLHLDRFLTALACQALEGVDVCRVRDEQAETDVYLFHYDGRKVVVLIADAERLSNLSGLGDTQIVRVGVGRVMTNILLGWQP